MRLDIASSIKNGFNFTFSSLVTPIFWSAIVLEVGVLVIDSAFISITGSRILSFLMISGDSAPVSNGLELDFRLPKSGVVIITLVLTETRDSETAGGSSFG